MYYLCIQFIITFKRIVVYIIELKYQNSFSQDPHWKFIFLKKKMLILKNLRKQSSVKKT